jgi:hypothetical protein
MIAQNSTRRIYTRDAYAPLRRDAQTRVAGKLPASLITCGNLCRTLFIKANCTPLDYEITLCYVMAPARRVLDHGNGKYRIAMERHK